MYSKGKVLTDSSQGLQGQENTHQIGGQSRFSSFSQIADLPPVDTTNKGNFEKAQGSNLLYSEADETESNATDESIISTNQGYIPNSTRRADHYQTENRVLFKKQMTNYQHAPNDLVQTSVWMISQTCFGSTESEIRRILAQVNTKQKQATVWNYTNIIELLEDSIKTLTVALEQLNNDRGDFITACCTIESHLRQELELQRKKILELESNLTIESELRKKVEESQERHKTSILEQMLVIQPQQQAKLEALQREMDKEIIEWKIKYERFEREFEEMKLEKHLLKDECMTLSTSNKVLENQKLTLEINFKDAEKKLQEKVEVDLIRYQRENTELKLQLQELQSKETILAQEVRTLRDKVHNNSAIELKYQTDIEHLEKQLREGGAMKDYFETEKKRMKQSLDDQSERYNCLSKEKEEIYGKNLQLQKEIDNLSNSSSVSSQELRQKENELKITYKRLIDQERLFQSENLLFKNKILELEDKCRQYRNQLQELRGNVRVFARVRPFMLHESERNNILEVLLENDSIRIFSKDKNDGEFNEFQFNKVFSPSYTQKEVFDEVADFVQSSLDGYNVSLLSYGQTGAGKTHTMQGYGMDDNRGIIPRSMEHIGMYKRKMEEQGWRYQMKVTFLEIYNEQIRDLLATDKDNQSFSERKELPHDIRHDEETGITTISNLTAVDIDPEDHEQVEGVMRLAAKMRSVGSTDMNAVSSRSHAVFTLTLQARNELDDRMLCGQLHLVDLAGSERLSKSNSTGDRLKEAQAINRSLSCLTDVFVAIAKKTPHIPFRNSKLTYLLQSALSGQGKACMMVCLSPNPDSYQESLSTLRFGSNVSQCELGKAQKKIYDFGSNSAFLPTAPTLSGSSVKAISEDNFSVSASRVQKSTISTLNTSRNARTNRFSKVSTPHASLRTVSVPPNSNI